MRSQNRKKKSDGFTLVEIIVVLVILAVLAAIVIPSFSGWIEKARQKRLVTTCRACVTAAQALVTEAYAEKGREISIPTDAEVRGLAGIERGKVSNVSLATSDKVNSMQISTLTYTDDDGMVVTYVRDAAEKFDFSTTLSWTSGDAYNIGDIMQTNGGVAGNPVLIFRCIRGHTAGEGQYTRNPAAKANKSTWEVIGTASGKPENYSYTLRYAVGVTVVYEGKVYARKAYDLSAGQTPYLNSSSDYWELLGPVEP